MRITFALNGTEYTREVRPDRRLLDFLREDLGVLSVREGCGAGECCACTVLLNGEAVHACLTLTGQIDGGEVLTVEGLSRDGELDVLQQAFLDHSAIQCGYCTPGMILSAKALLLHNPHPTDEEIREAISGNICRCSGYQEIRTAIAAAAEAGASAGKTVGRKPPAAGAKLQAEEGYLQPASHADLLEALGKMTENSRFIAGGTDVLVERRREPERPDLLVSLSHVPELHEIRMEPEGYGAGSAGMLRIGAAVTHAAIAADPLVRRYFTALAEACGMVGSQQIRNRGTLGGNLCNATPADDTMPCVLLYGGELEILDASGLTRRIPAEELVTGFGRTSLVPGEILTAVLLPVREDRKSAFVKLGSRKSVTTAQLSMAVSWETEGTAVTAADAYLGAVSLRPVRIPEIGEILRGSRAEDTDLCVRALNDVLRARIRSEQKKRTRPSRLKITEDERRYKERAAIGIADDVCRRVLAEISE